MSVLGFVLIALAAAVAGALPGVVGALAGKRLSDDQKRMLPVLGVTVALAIVLPIGWALRGPQVKWVNFSSTEGGFRASFPSVPSPNTTTAGPADKQVRLHQFVSHSAAPSLECVVAYVDYSPETLAAGKPEDVLASARDGAARDGKGTVTLEKPFSLGGYPGKAFKIEHEQAWVYTRIVLAKERLFVVTIATPVNVPEPSEVGTFLDSFELVR